MYNGAKSKVRGFTHIIQSCIRSKNDIYWEPFFGAGRIMERIHGCRRYGSDTNRFVVHLIRAIQSGWQPPDKVNEKDHEFYLTKSREEPNSDDPMIAFVGHGCCFSGVFFGGFARNQRGVSTNKFAIAARTSLLKQRPLLADVELLIRDYRKGFWHPEQPTVIYCDPPYAGTSAVGSDRQTKTKFDSVKFWEWCQKQHENGSTVLVSEYTCPLPNAQIIWQQTYEKSLRSSDGVRQKVERLFCLGDRRAISERVGFGFE
jgi:site-specific DNA-adenine methylase